MIEQAPWRHVTGWQGPSMGGRLTIDLTLAGSARRPEVREARRASVRVARRVEAWAAGLTRFDPRSDLCRLNRSAEPLVDVRPTLAAVLAWARDATALSDGIVDPTLLRERLAAEAGHDGPGVEGAQGPWHAPSPWAMDALARGARVCRPAGALFDLDGVAKGWLADRALRLLHPWAGAIVDADGDIAIRLAPGDALDVGVAAPEGGDLLGRIVLTHHPEWPAYGIATSGTTVHRWPTSADQGSDRRHHLIDPRTRRPAATDLLQATVVARSAREAEVLAKQAVILGSQDGLAAMQAAGARFALLVGRGGRRYVTRPGPVSLEAA